MTAETVVGLVIAGILLAWLFRKLGLSDVVGYVIGGAIAAAILTMVGIDVEANLEYTEPLRWLGLTLFSFTSGTSIGFRKIVENLQRVVATELLVYVVLWITTGFIAWIIHLNHAERTVFFILLVNSSTVALVALVKHQHITSEALKERAIIQSSMEDVLQFVLFTLLFIAEISLTRDFIRAATQVVVVIGLTILLFTLGRYLLQFLSKTTFIADKDNKFIISVGTALLFASTASMVGLPPLFGAFTAGVSFSLFLSLEDVSDMINGLKNLGLLLYFTSIGSQIYLNIVISSSHDIVLSGVILGLIAYALRFFGLFIATLLIGSSISESFILALHLSLLSEMGIIFVDTLAREGVISSRPVALSVMAVLVSMLLFGILAPKLSPRVSRLEKIIPRGITVFS